MKKTLFFLLLAFVAFNAKAQDKFVPETFLGLKGGVTYSGFGFDPSIDQEMLLGYTGGLVLKHLSQSKLGVQVEANLVQRGWTEVVAPDTSYTRRLTFVELPFMTHLSFGARNSRFIVNLGPTASFLIKDEVSSDVADPNGELEGDEVKMYRYRDIDNEFIYGLCLGIGFEQRTAIGTFQLEGRFTHSLNDIFSRDLYNRISKSQSLSLTMSYLLSLRSRKAE
ncbi:porin family protein [Pontibacter korlensis]|uniref:Outer membrane protein beta-barrel domain-containing protein n=1 Tax=Pontibacter korlensis TaxID=400092 RepID=A0A0E3ZC52_9BACT|nr:porin family protein [Pontibacter korlensis]AKD02393.1 hypothetical protein PKOR_03710 [Pontibacter korlensis]